ncbi:MAG: HAMP domain-containing sensor histidine kinase [Dehalococcoidia bacterium]|jgi:signal transduction histidine kinase|nr:HAMP domain-containing sensor histidine kinase [Dehalococcoidia bacterium]
MKRLIKPLKISGGVIALAGVILLILAPFLGKNFFDLLWAVEPFTYLGGVLMVLGLGMTATTYVGTAWLRRNSYQVINGQNGGHSWSETTLQYFQLFDHDLGRPLRRIAGKERELRAVMQANPGTADAGVIDLLDEIERQTPNFRLMMSNIQVLIQLESPESDDELLPVEPNELIRRIADRYTPVAAEAGKEITWWSEPSELGLVYANTNAIEHIVTNLVDNAVRFAGTHVEVKLTKNPTHFFVRVWDDGPGIGTQYVPHLFDRGWTPEVVRREEKSSSGLGLFIARSLARQSGGDLTVESDDSPDGEHHTAFLLSLPSNLTAQLNGVR